MRSALLIAVCFIHVAVRAQSAALAAGGDASGAGGSLAWSIGQVACMAASAPVGTVYEGVQQPYIDIGTATNGPTLVAEVRVFPTATSARLVIEWPAGTPDHAWAELVDVNGALVRSWPLPDARSELNISSLAVGHYRMLVRTPGSAPVVFPLIKTP